MINPSINVSGTAIVILAAGQSQRLGQPKQLVDVGGKTLLQHQVATASSTGLPVYVVLGANSQFIQQLSPSNVSYLENQYWQTGMSSSIRCAVENINADAWLFMTVDQYRLTTEHLMNMLQCGSRRITEQGRHECVEQTLVATSYASRLAVPALIPAKYRDQLLALRGDKGAGGFIRQLSQQHPQNAATVENQTLRYDVDMAQDLITLKQYFQSHHAGERVKHV